MIKSHQVTANKADWNPSWDLYHLECHCSVKYTCMNVKSVWSLFCTKKYHTLISKIFHSLVKLHVFAVIFWLVKMFLELSSIERKIPVNFCLENFLSIFLILYALFWSESVTQWSRQRYSNLVIYFFVNLSNIFSHFI